jgi:hypothetical protein
MGQSRTYSGRLTSRLRAAISRGRRQGVEYTSGCEAIDKADDSNGTLAFPVTDPLPAVGFG